MNLFYYNCGFPLYLPEQDGAKWSLNWIRPVGKWSYKMVQNSMFTVNTHGYAARQLQNLSKFIGFQ